MIVASANAYAFMASVVLFIFSSRVAKVSSQAVRFSGCDSLVEHKTVHVTVAMDAPGSGACSFQPLTQAQFKLTRANGQIDVICTQNLASGCDTTPTPEGCVCKGLVNNVYTFELDLNFTTSVHAGGTLDLEPNCFPSGVYATRTKCTNLQAVDPCDLINCQNGGRCESDNGNAKCVCNGTYHTGDTCQVDPCENRKDCSVTTFPHTAHIIEDPDPCCTNFIIVVVVFPLCFLGAIANTIRLWYTKKFSSVICVTVCVETKEKKRTLQSVDTKNKVQRFISKHFTLYCCCCCCCCNWLGGCFSGGLIWRNKPGVDDDDGGEDVEIDQGAVESGGVAVASGMGCNMCCCVCCLSAVKKVEVDVYCNEDKRALVLITLEAPLSWYADAEDMPAKVKEYIRTKILKEPAKELCNTSKPSMHLSVGFIAGSPDPPNEPPAGEQSNTSKPSTCFGFGCIADSPDRRNEPPVDYPAGAPKAQTQYTGNRNGSGR